MFNSQFNAYAASASPSTAGGYGQPANLYDQRAAAGPDILTADAPSPVLLDQAELPGSSSKPRVRAPPRLWSSPGGWADSWGAQH